MPEGPEVRRHAEKLSAALVGKPILAIDARTRNARAWLSEHGHELTGLVVRRVFSHGKHLVGLVGDEYFFHSHLMMWGTWRVVAPDDPLALARDRRERARIAVADAVAILTSAPIFDVGRGDPYVEIPMLSSLGPDIIPYPDQGPFDLDEFMRRLMAASEETIGAALLDQRIVSGIGNYLRAEILFECGIDPWRTIGELTAQEIHCLGETVPLVGERALAAGGRTVSDEMHQRMLHDPSLVYQPGKTFGARHYVFRRTNLPCLRCGDTIRQTRQVTRRAIADEEEDKTRIIYFCPTCQKTSVPLKPVRRRRQP